MARKREEFIAPVVTSLPLPSSDSVLVIDLPDGQKLLVGKMSHGSVIEVATWRGTGRPDSRTNRLMLGMSSSESENQLGAPDPQDNLVIDKRSIKYWIWLLKQIIRKIKSQVSITIGRIIGLVKKKKSGRELSKPLDKIEDDVQAWLDNIKSARPRNSVALPNSKKSISSPKSAVTVRKSVKKSSKKGN